MLEDVLEDANPVLHVPPIAHVPSLGDRRRVSDNLVLYRCEEILYCRFYNNKPSIWLTCNFEDE